MLEALHQRQTGVDHRRERPGEDDEVLLRDAAEARELEVELERLLLHLDRAGSRASAGDCSRPRRRRPPSRPSSTSPFLVFASQIQTGTFAFWRRGRSWMRCAWAMRPPGCDGAHRRAPAESHAAASSAAILAEPTNRSELPAYRGPRPAAGPAAGPAAAAEHVAQLVGVGGAAEGLVQRDEPLLHEGRQRLVDGLHAVLLLADLHLRVDLVDLVLADQVPDGGVGDHDLQASTRPGAPLRRQQRLGDHALEHERELRAHLRLLVGREDVDDAVDGLHAAVGVQGREGQVAGLGDDQRRLDGLQVAHLADEHDVRVLAQDVLERLLEGAGVGADLALVDQAVLVRVQVLDRVLDGDDVLVPLGVDLVDRSRRASSTCPSRSGR